jgi:Helix-turn-helix.
MLNLKCGSFIYESISRIESNFNKYFRKGGEKLYKKFEALLLKHNKTTYLVAKETGIGQNIFSNWKTGRSNPKIDKLQRIATYFGVSLEYFLEE